MGWQVIIAPSARADLAEIVRFVARHDSESAARLGYELITGAEKLAAFPEIGRVVPEFQRPELREVICRSYRIIYRITHANQSLEVVRFWHGARGFPHIPGRGC